MPTNKKILIFFLRRRGKGDENEVSAIAFMQVFFKYTSSMSEHFYI